MSEEENNLFERGEPVWVLGEDGSQRAAEYVGEADMSAWFGGPPRIIVVFEDDHSGAEVLFERVVRRDT
jgi:hypothetical protein